MSYNNDGEFHIGKRVFTRLYCHVLSLPQQSTQAQAIVLSAAKLAHLVPGEDFNIVRFDRDGESIGLLQYPGFFDQAFPTLSKSWKVDLKTNRLSVRIYEDSYNPPILHRKELMLPDGHPEREAFAVLTSELDALGLFNDSVRIGFKLQWEKLLSESGFRVVGHTLVPIGNQEHDPEDLDESAGLIEISRHLTALSRQSFSAPMQMLRRNGFLDGMKSVFDYGCGKGDDIRGLRANAIVANGWDPHYAPNAPIESAAIVNLGFVINVIEDPVERRDALVRAYSLADELLVVSTMIASELRSNAISYGDGVLSSRSTFQKYYTQSELREYLAITLASEPISVAPGIFFVFKDRTTEQQYLISRYRSRVRTAPLLRPERPQSIPRHRPVRQKRLDLFDTHRELLDALWARCLDLGREPEPSEIPDLKSLEQNVGSVRKALRLCCSHHDPTQLDKARQQRTDDLLVYLALQQFQRRRPYRQLEPRLQADIRAFFGDYSAAQEQSKQLLFLAAKIEKLDEACEFATAQGLGWYEPSQSLQLHASLVQRLPAVLRVYVGCAGVLYGDVNEADLVKIHIRSGKVSFLKFDDFLESPLPHLTERTKINLRTLDLSIFRYGGEHPKPLLYLKSRYLNEELPRYAEQVAFDEQLVALDCVDLSAYGPSAEEFTRLLQRSRWSVDEFKLQRVNVAPGLDELCGNHFTYRQLIECGETQRSTRTPNLPRNVDSYAALRDLALNILDPVVDYFGGIDLTYGFCSADLAKRIPGRNAPALDQHAALENKRTGAPICSRLGAAVDFIVKDESMREVADWIVENLPFDRLYFYADDRPLHVSYGPDNARNAYQMMLTEKGLRVPRPYQNVAGGVGRTRY